MNLLVVAAWEPELERFRELAPGQVGGAVGVGVVESAIGTTRLLAAHSAAPVAVVFVGTCGALPGSGLAPGDVVVVARARLVDAATLDGRAAPPGPMPCETPCDPELVARATGAGLRAVSALTTLGITTSDALATSLASHGEVEHLEAFAVARACASSSVAFVAILAVANPVGADGRSAWLANHVQASARAAEAAHRVFG